MFFLLLKVHNEKKNLKKPHLLKRFLKIIDKKSEMY